MPELKFEILSSEVRPFEVMPTIIFKLQITNEAENEEVYAAALKCQIMIEAIKRSYNEESKEKLQELFGKPERWEETLKTFFWTIVNIPVPRFTGSTILEVPVHCSEDQALAAGKYFHSVSEGTVPLAFLFSGTLFYKDPSSELQITQIPWEKEAFHKMPAALWTEMMETYFPNSRWMRIRKEVYDRLVKHKANGKHATLQNCLEELIDETLKDVRLTENQNM